MQSLKRAGALLGKRLKWRPTPTGRDHLSWRILGAIGSWNCSVATFESSLYVARRYFYFVSAGEGVKVLGAIKGERGRDGRKSPREKGTRLLRVNCRRHSALVFRSLSFRSVSGGEAHPLKGSSFSPIRRSTLLFLSFFYLSFSLLPAIAPRK